MDANEKKEIIKKKYGEVAMKGSSSCFGGCCSDIMLRICQNLLVIPRMILRLFLTQIWASVVATRQLLQS